MNRFSLTINRLYVAFIVLISILVVEGCGSTPLSRYPHFLEQKKKIQRATVMMDCSIVEAILGDTDKVDVVRNREIATMCLNLFAGSMNQKEYRVEKTFLSSVGMMMNENRVSRVAQTPDDQQLDNEQLPVSSPPFYVHQAYNKVSIGKDALKKVYSSLIRTVDHKGDSLPKIPEAMLFQSETGDGTLFVVVVSGIEVPVSKQLGERVISESLTERSVAIQPITQLSVFLFVIDTMSGEVIWDDHIYKKGGTIYPAKILKMAKHLIENLP